MPGRKGQGSIKESEQSVQSSSQPSPSFHQTLGTCPGPRMAVGLSCKFSRWFLTSCFPPHLGDKDLTV